MMNNCCWNCGKDVPQTDGKRLKLYCNDKCRMQYKRKQSSKSAEVIINNEQAMQTIAEQNGINEQLESEQTITEQSMPNKGQSGKCWCCGDDIHLGLVCCGPCAWSGKAKEKRDGQYPPLLTDRTPEQMEADLHSKELTGPKPVVVGKPGDEEYNGICK